MNLLLFLGSNGYLFRRELFEKQRRGGSVEGGAAGTQSFGGLVSFAGVVTAGLFPVPRVDLIVPTVATAFMAHLFAGPPRAETDPSAPPTGQPKARPSTMSTGCPIHVQPKANRDRGP
ncbi:MAG TPA: hypothetical protein VM755_18940 [Stellaceae bacterium]|nr:hypothetical protein [Stellaceae bacterium]